MSSALAALEARVCADLAKTAHPTAAWLNAMPGPGKPALDFLIIGAGQSGIATGSRKLQEKQNDSEFPGTD
jgi:hypothetical protein